ncbi:hypothetical protein CRX57_05560 [Pseudomonas putida]|jgi:hypothetical protein|uniref:Uncharacterized protein n=1 Tax=Pseudomonas putida TaxID=303 RepID=A0A2C5W7K2_PSEPU|nr:hypothetical protein CRX57_05560 [Pseudomonas putida]
MRREFFGTSSKPIIQIGFFVPSQNPRKKGRWMKSLDHLIDKRDPAAQPFDVGLILCQPGLKMLAQIHE